MTTTVAVKPIKKYSQHNKICYIESMIQQKSSRLVLITQLKMDEEKNTITKRKRKKKTAKNIAQQ